MRKMFQKQVINNLTKENEYVIIYLNNNSNEQRSRTMPKEELSPTCEFHHIHDDLVKTIGGKLPSDEVLYDLAELFKVFGDSTRIRILYVLFESEMCVCDIAQLLGMTISAISHQLRILKQARLVKYRREGKTVFYSLSDDHVRSIIDQGTEHIGE